MRKKVFSIINFVITLYAFYELISKVYVLKNGWVYVLIFVVLMIAYYSYLFIRRPNSIKEFNVNNMYLHRICLNSNKLLIIHKDTTSTVTVTKKMVYFQQPELDDLFDIYSIHQDQINNFVYNSPDAIETKREFVKKTRFKIFWKPKTAIAPFVEYTHEDTWKPDTVYTEYLFYSSFHITEVTGKCQIDVRSYRCIYEAYSFCTKRNRRFKDCDHMLAYAKHNKHALNNPVIDSTKKKIFWEHTNPKIGYTYWCVYVFRKPAGD